MSTPLILVADDVEETRDLIEQLLQADGYRVAAARGAADAIDRAGRERPDLILLSLGARAGDPMAAALGIRQGAGMSAEVPVVVFCNPAIEEGAELAAGRNVHLTRPDNFDQLRALIARLLQVAAVR